MSALYSLDQTQKDSESFIFIHNEATENVRKIEKEMTLHLIIYILSHNHCCRNVETHFSTNSHYTKLTGIPVSYPPNQDIFQSMCSMKDLYCQAVI